MAESESPARIRVDRWLWFARITRSRTLAQNLIRTGKLRVNNTRISSPSHAVGPGDALTLTLPRQIRILEIVACGTRRGPATEAQTLYVDHSPPVERPDPFSRPAKQAVREEGAGRPTKKERRELEQFRKNAAEKD